MALMLIQPDGTGTCCGCRPTCAACAPPAVDSVTCVSRTGSSTIRGWSKFTNFNSGDWNTRKAKRYNHDWKILSCFYGYASNCNSLTESNLTHSAWGERVGYYAWNVSTNSNSGFTGTATTRFWDPDGDGGTKGCSYGEIGVSVGATDFNPLPREKCIGYDFITYADIDVYVTDPFGNDPRDFSPRNASFSDDHNALLTAHGCGLTHFECSGSGSPLYTAGGGSQSLSDFDTVADARARASATTGSLCKTRAGTIGTTSALSTTQISLGSNTTAVTATIACSSLTASADYELTIDIKRYTAGGGAYVDTIEDTVTFTASGTTEDVEYEVPVNTDYDYEIDTSAVTIAVA
jgi:hypothetical protein